MMLKRKTKILIITLIAALTIFVSGCGRTYHIRGRVVFLPQLGSPHSVIAEITGQLLPSGGVPMVGAKIRMIHELNKNGSPKEGSVWQTNALSNTTGDFEISDYAAPYDNAPVGLEVSKEGYETAYTTYIDYLDQEHDKSEKTQTFFVVMLPSASNKSLQPMP